MTHFDPNSPVPRSREVSYLFWALLGYFGGHRFYNRRPASAWAMLALALIGMFGSAVSGSMAHAGRPLGQGAELWLAVLGWVSTAWFLADIWLLRRWTVPDETLYDPYGGQTVARLLWLVSGLGGGHRFFAGRTKSALLMLLAWPATVVAVVAATVAGQRAEVQPGLAWVQLLPLLALLYMLAVLITWLVDYKRIPAWTHPQVLPAPNNRGALLVVLWFFYGVLGGHRFYTGRHGSGALMAALLVAPGVLVAQLLANAVVSPNDSRLAIALVPWAILVFWWIADGLRLRAWIVHFRAQKEQALLEAQH